MERTSSKDIRFPIIEHIFLPRILDNMVIYQLGTGRELEEILYLYKTYLL
jgi:hypothetical protein